MYNDRIELYKQVSKRYNPETKRTEQVMDRFREKPYPCQLSPISRQRELATFGQTEVASTVARFMNPLPEGVQYAEAGGKKYEVVDSRNYQHDAILYLREVVEW